MSEKIPATPKQVEKPIQKRAKTTTTTTSTTKSLASAVVNIPSASQCKTVEKSGRVQQVLHAFKDGIYNAIWASTDLYNPFTLSTPYKMTDEEKTFLDTMFSKKGYKCVITDMPENTFDASKTRKVYNKISVFF